MLTIPQHSFVPYLPPGCAWIAGQLERGSDDGYLHWQLVVAFSQKKSLTGVRSMFGPVHAELSRSAAADAYCAKEETRVPGTPFELGEKPFRRNSRTDWDRVWASAACGDLLQVPADVRVRCFNQLRRIGSDYARPVGMERSVVVYWGPTGSGKSRRAFAEAGLEAFTKCARTKWWDGYLGERAVVLDEFRGAIDIGHLLRWFDRYPVRVEIKGGAVPLCAERFWITSNLHPKDWFPELDYLTYQALERRIEIINLS